MVHGGTVPFGGDPNPGGLTGQVNLAVDTSGGPTGGGGPAQAAGPLRPGRRRLPVAYARAWCLLGVGVVQR